MFTFSTESINPDNTLYNTIFGLSIASTIATGIEDNLIMHDNIHSGSMVSSSYADEGRDRQ